MATSEPIAHAFGGLHGASWQAAFTDGNHHEFTRLLETLPAAAYTCDADGLITYYNARAVDLWGRKPKLRDPVERYCGSFRLFAPDGAAIPHERCWMAMALRDDRVYNGYEIVIEREDGTSVTGLAHATPIHDETGKLIGAVNVLVDITEQKQTEELLREADRSKTEFLAMLAHELRNPLAPMHNALQIMRRAGDDGVAVDRAQETIERQLHHLTRIVDDLLDLSRISRNRLELRTEPIDLRAVVQQAVETARPQIDAAHHDLTVTLPSEPMRLNGDPVRLAQLLANLLANAAAYTPSGGSIWIEAAADGDDAVIRVRDSGIGMSVETIQHIFEMFARAGEVVHRAQGGLGIGLTLARRIAELHGGTIIASSPGLGMGTELEVRIPATGPAATATEDRGPTVREEASPLRVLIVDDNRDAAETMGELLALGGHAVETVHEGQAALDVAAVQRPDVVLLDIGLPGMSGYEVARRLRHQPWGQDLLVVAVTGWGQAEDRDRSRRAGIDHHLVKPVDVAALEQLIAGVTLSRDGTA